MPLAIGSHLGPYEVSALVGMGGMGEVYRARDRKLDRDVALKVLPEAVAADAERLARFEREAKTLAALNHAHIAHVYGLEEGTNPDGSRLRAIVMELVDGEDLSQVIARGAIAPVNAIAMAGQIAEALEAAHEQGIVHRDLKPANIKLRADGSIKVLDFGLAKAIELPGHTPSGSLAPTITTPAMTHAGVVLGTAAYMSPEQAKGKFIDRRTDIWAFGAVLYEMLTASRAFEGEDVTDTIVALISKEPDWSRLPADTPAVVRTLLRRCLEKDARRRLRDIGEARILIADLNSGKIDATPVAVASSASPRSIWRNVVPIAITVLIMMLAGYAAGLQFRPAPPAPTPARLVVPLSDDWPFIRAGGPMLAISPDGSKIVYIGNNQLYVRPLGSFESTVIAGSESSDPANPFFSPDGQWVGFMSVAGASLKKIAVSGGTPVTLMSIPIPGPGAFQGAEWVGDEIFYSAAGRGIMKVSANGGEPQVVIPVAPPASAYGAQRLPGGSILFALAGDETGERWDRAEIVVAHPDTGERKTVFRGGGAPRYLPTGHLVYAVDGAVMAVSFDLQRLEVSGEPVKWLDDVRRVQYVVSGAAQYVVSTNGNLAFIPGAITIPDQRSIVLLDQQGALQRIGVPPALYEHPRISPDGRRFVVHSARTVWVADLLPKTTLRRMSFGGDGRFPLWSPDGRFVLYVSDRDGQRAVYRQAADGGGAPERVFAHDALRKIEAFHRDGRTMLISMTTDDGDLGTVTPDGAYHALVAGPGAQASGAFSPDGRWFSYSSSLGGLTQLFIEPFPRTGASYQVTTETGGASLWMPDGRRIIFQTALGMSEIDRMASVTVSTSPGFSVEAPVPVETFGAILSGSAFDVTPDGKQLLLLRPVAAETAAKPQLQQINVVMNAFEELKQRVPVRR